MGGGKKKGMVLNRRVVFLRSFLRSFFNHCRSTSILFAFILQLEKFFSLYRSHHSTTNFLEHGNFKMLSFKRFTDFLITASPGTLSAIFRPFLHLQDCFVLQ